jgi:thioredoxin 1
MSNLYELKKSQDFIEINNDKTKTIVLDFYAVWCKPCQSLGKSLEEVSKKYSDVEFMKVNVENENCEELVDRFNVTGIPRVIIIQGKTIEKDISGNKLDEITNHLDNMKKN